MLDIVENFLGTGYSFYSTILGFGLTEQQIALLEDCVRNKRTLDKVASREKPIRIYATDEITDIYAIPFFLAIINFEAIEVEEKHELFAFWEECCEPYPPEMKDNCENNQKFVIYAFNIDGEHRNTSPNIHFVGDVFSNTDKLKLDILSMIKDNEGVGRKACQTSIRIYRVLSMYKCLLDEKILTKAMTDKICYPDQVSKRTFYKDIQIIKEIEDDRLIYDKSLKGYVLKEQ